MYHGDTIKRQDFRLPMSLKEFCDRFNPNWNKGRDDESSHLQLSKRGDRSETVYKPIRLKPHLTEKKCKSKVSTILAIL